jgi:hypothetical protein
MRACICDIFNKITGESPTYLSKNNAIKRNCHRDDSNYQMIAL